MTQHVWIFTRSSYSGANTPPVPAYATGTVAHNGECVATQALVPTVSTNGHNLNVVHDSSESTRG